MPPPFSSMSQWKIPHPGRMAGQAVMKLTMPAVLGWVLGGNVGNIEKSRAAQCRIADQPHGFSERSFPLFMASDEAITRAIKADWLLITQRQPGSGASGSNGLVDTRADRTSTTEAKGIYISDADAVIGGSGAKDAQLVVEDTNVMPRHAKVWRSLSNADSLSSPVSSGEQHNGGPQQSYDFFVQDLGSNSGTWLNGRQMAHSSTARLRPGDILEFGRSPSHEVYRVKLQHISLRNSDLRGQAFTTCVVGSNRGSQSASEKSLAIA